jgi:hypothetical protein
MKIKHSILFIAMLTLSACAQTVRAEQQTNTSATAAPVVDAVVTQAEATNTMEARCFRNSEATQLLINFAQEYCLQYPTGYDIAFQSEADTMLVKQSILNAEDPNLIINIDPADGKTIEQFADQLVADYSIPGLEVKRESLVIDQEPAIRIDGLTGQDPNRQVVVIHNDRFYHLTFVLMQNSPEVRAQAEALYNTVIQSFSFHPETNLRGDCLTDYTTPEN